MPILGGPASPNHQSGLVMTARRAGPMMVGTVTLGAIAGAGATKLVGLSAIRREVRGSAIALAMVAATTLVA